MAFFLLHDAVPGDVVTRKNDKWNDYIVLGVGPWSRDDSNERWFYVLSANEVRKVQLNCEVRFVQRSEPRISDSVD